MSLGHALKSWFYNSTACSRHCGQSLHSDQATRFFSCGGLVASFNFDRCSVFSVTPPVAPQLLNEEQQTVALAVAADALPGSTQDGEADALAAMEPSATRPFCDATLASPSSMVAHVLCSGPTVSEVARITGGVGVASHERLGEMMQDENALSEVELKCEGAEKDSEVS